LTRDTKIIGYGAAGAICATVIQDQAQGIRWSRDDLYDE
jgi:hypothetical protein